MMQNKTPPPPDDRTTKHTGVLTSHRTHWVLSLVVFILWEYCVIAPTLMSNYDFTLDFVIVVILSLLCY